MKAKDLMSADKSVVGQWASIEVVEALAAAMHVRHFPVVDSEQKTVGIVSVRDVLKYYAQLDRDDSLRVCDIMTSNPAVVSCSSDISEVARLMRDNNVSCIPVVDELQQIVGIITERDFVHLYLKTSETNATF